MSYYFFASRATDILGGTDDFTAGRFDAEYTDRAIRFANNELGQFAWGTPLTDFWFQCSFGVFGSQWSGTSTIDGVWMQFYNDDGELVGELDLNNGNTRVRVGDGGTLTTGGQLPSPGDGVLIDLTVRIQINEAGNNVLTMYSDGVFFLSVSHPFTDSSGIARVVFVNSDTNNSMYYSQIAIADEDIRFAKHASMDLPTLGSLTDWTGGVADIQFRVDGLYILSDAAGQRISFNTGGYPGVATPSAIRGVFIQSIGKVGSIGPQQVDHFVRLGGVNYDTGINKSPDPSVVNISEFATNPATTVAWTIGDLTGMEVGPVSVA